MEGRQSGSGGSAVEGYHLPVPRHDIDDTGGEGVLRNGEPGGEGLPAQAGEAIPVGADTAGSRDGWQPSLPHGANTDSHVQ